MNKTIAQAISRIVPEPNRHTLGGWRLANGHFVLHEEDVKAMRTEAKHYRIAPVDVNVTYFHETMKRSMFCIELREREWFADAVTGQLYSTETLQCQTDPRMQMEGLAA